MVYDNVVYDSVVYDNVVYDNVVYDNVVYDNVVRRVKIRVCGPECLVIMSGYNVWL